MGVLRAESGAAVPFVHHVGHEGTRMRGSSDLAGWWESAITVKKGDDGQRDHPGRAPRGRGQPHHDLPRRLRPHDRSVRLNVVGGSLRERVAAYLADHPDATANEVVDAMGANRAEVLKTVAEMEGR